MTYTTDTSTDLPIPRESRPVVCQERYCSYSFKSDIFDPAGAVFVHESGGVRSEMPIPDEWFADVDRDIWTGDVLPWIEGLHREAV